MARPILDAPAYVFPSSYASGIGCDSEALFGISAAMLTTNLTRAKTLITNVYGHSDHTLLEMMDVGSARRVTEGVVQVPSGTTHLAYEVKFLVANVTDESAATLEHRIRFWDGGAVTTGYSSTGALPFKTFKTDRHFTQTGVYEYIWKGKRYKERPKLPPGADQLFREQSRVVPRIRTTYHNAVRINDTSPGLGIFDWPYQAVRGEVALSGVTSILSTTSMTFVDIDVVGPTGLNSDIMYKPLCVVVWAEVRDDGT